MRHNTPRTLLLALLVAVGGSLAVRAEQMAPAPDVLTALLTEVRGLRAVLEQMATAGPRVQLALGRLQLQEQRIGNQVRRLDSVRAGLLAAQRELEPLERLATEVTQTIRDYPNSEGRREDERKLAEIKAELAKRQVEVQRLLTEESLLTQDISAEQNRWTEFNQRLEELERALARR
jgi:predicted nuclease with TOPRIM domain